jgi:uroporphyrinogen decarboxylase
MELKAEDPAAAGEIFEGSRFVRACLRRPVDRTPVWFLRQAGRYMQEYRDVRKHHTLVEICKNPELAAEVTITAAEKLGVDAAIIFADLLLPLEPMRGRWCTIRCGAQRMCARFAPIVRRIWST